MAKIIDEFPKEKYSGNVTRYEITNELIDKHNVLDLVIKDLARYIDKANDLWKSGVLKKENIDKIELFNLPFTHRSNVANRLAFLRSLLSSSYQ
jgi:hypothetical protein